MSCSGNGDICEVVVCLKTKGHDEMKERGEGSPCSTVEPRECAGRLWATTTPIHDRERPREFDPRTARVRARNAIARAVVEAERIPVDDLFGLVEGHPEYFAPDGMHFGEKGVEAQAGQVARSVGAALPPS